MPAHSSHYLQPLDVGCFSPLKKAYTGQIERLIRNSYNHITKETFLDVFKQAHSQAITKDNILGAFHGSGLVPYNLDTVISKLDIKLCIPSPLPTAIEEE